MNNKNKLFVVILSIFLLFVPAAYARDFSNEESLASNLKALGLFKGVSETSFDLERQPTRVEALVMLIRTLGKEQEALNGKWSHPFIDVPDWANQYVGYAYENKLTNGISETEFGTSNANASMYLTFVLRALGYSDTNGQDFLWSDPYSLSKKVGILPDKVDTNNFLRADVVLVSYYSLQSNLKNSDITLATKLINANVFTQKQFDLFYQKNMQATDINQDYSDNSSVLSSKQISDKCSSAVFNVSIYALNGQLAGNGSGFFISRDGWAITNYHVAANSSFLVVKTTDNKIYDKVQIVDYDKTNDLALIKVDGNNFNFLEIDSTSNIVQGQTVYAIGSPLGLENTMSQGIISNVNRQLDNTTYIQISVPIAPGSSGGALINEYGKVIGVTSAGFVNSTGDLNLAIPIKNIEKLEKNLNNDYTLWMDKYYPGFSNAYDFGYFTGVKLVDASETSTGYVFYYDAFDFHDNFGIGASTYFANAINIYQQALLMSGFEYYENHNYDDGFSGIYSNFSTSENVILILDLENEVITIMPSHTVKTYTDFLMKVPDLGSYMNMDGKSQKNEDGSMTYEYRWIDYYSYEEMLSNLQKYMDVLSTIYEYQFISTNNISTFLFVKDNISIVIILDGNYLYVDVK